MIASPAAIAAVAYAALYSAHQVLDHWGQTSHQAANKGRADWRGRRACLSHVTVYTLGCLAAVIATAAALGHLHQLHPAAVTTAALINGGTHYWADRRATLARLAKRTGHDAFYRTGAGHGCLGTGAYALDQSWHIGWLLVCAVVTAIGAH